MMSAKYFEYYTTILRGAVFSWTRCRMLTINVSIPNLKAVAIRCIVWTTNMNPHIGLLSTDRGWWRWALVSPDRVACSRMVGVSASVNLPFHHKVQKFSSGIGSPWCSRKKGRKTVVVWCGGLLTRNTGCQCSSITCSSVSKCVLANTCYIWCQSYKRLWYQNDCKLTQQQRCQLMDRIHDHSVAR